MSKPLQLHIPSPCHENWANMQPSEKGRHCAACQKTVVDFTAMSDAEIIRYMSKAGSQVCGRLAPDQVNRPLIPLTPPQQNRLPGWPLLLTGMLLTFDESATRQPVKQGKPVYEVRPKTSKSHHVTVGMVVAADISRRETVSKETVKKDSITLTAPQGLEGEIEPIKIDDSVVKANLAALDSTPLLKDTLPTHQPSPINDNRQSYQEFRGVLGGIVCIRPKKTYKLTKIISDTLTALRLIPQKQTPNPQLSNNELTIYPNPAGRGIPFHLAWQTAPGKYQVSLFSPSGALIQEQTLDIITTKQINDWQLPTNTPAGIYIIRAIRPGQTGVYARELVVQ